MAESIMFHKIPFDKIEYVSYYDVFYKYINTFKSKERDRITKGLVDLYKGFYGDDTVDGDACDEIYDMLVEMRTPDLERGISVFPDKVNVSEIKKFITEYMKANYPEFIKDNDLKNIHHHFKDGFTFTKVYRNKYQVFIYYSTDGFSTLQCGNFSVGISDPLFIWGVDSFLENKYAFFSNIEECKLNIYHNINMAYKFLQVFEKHVLDVLDI